MSEVSLSSFPPPYLKAIRADLTQIHSARLPYSIPSISSGIDLQLKTAVTFFVGQNGSGKSTLLEAIAARCGFNLAGGNRNHSYQQSFAESPLSKTLTLSWRQKTSRGFFFRAETFFNFATYLENLTKDSPSGEVFAPYGGKSLHEQSHGEAFLSLFTNRSQEGIFILDEPEAALSPSRQLSFLLLLRQFEQTGESQFLIATHSPILFSYPGATVMQVDDTGFHAVDYTQTEHFRLFSSFLASPSRYYRHLFKEPDRDRSGVEP